MSFASYRPIHSDFIVHWTGKDIDKELDCNWHTEHSSKVSQVTTARYLERLTCILRSGLWMKRDEKERELSISGKIITRPTPYRTCFTELRLSETRRHASQYGRLGIGFKRPFLFDRMGAPMIYFQDKWPNSWLLPPTGFDPTDLASTYYTTYLKPISTHQDDMMHYSYYDESEWRIIYDSPIDEILRRHGKGDVANRFKKAGDINDPKTKLAIAAATEKPGFLIPVKDKWLALIIYPSLAVKVLAQSDETIRSLISEIKPPFPSNDVGDHQNPACFEPYSKPVEIDLDACRNF
jgi:hypothetical protein